MAKIGLANLKYSILTESGEGNNYKATYNGAKSFGKAIDCKVTVESNTAELYADDMIAETDYTFKKGSLSLTVDEDDDTIFAEVLGHSISTDGDNKGEMVRKATDTAPYVGIGRILTKIVNGAYKYKVEFLTKVKFKEPSFDEKTKGESIEFATPSVEGTIMKLSNEEWSKTKTFSNKSDAVKYLDSLMAPPASV